MRKLLTQENRRRLGEEMYSKHATGSAVSISTVCYENRKYSFHQKYRQNVYCRWGNEKAGELEGEHLHHSQKPTGRILYVDSQEMTAGSGLCKTMEKSFKYKEKFKEVKVAVPGEGDWENQSEELARANRRNSETDTQSSRHLTTS